MSLSQEKNLPVLRKAPFFVVNKQFELINMVTDFIKEFTFHLVAISNCFVAGVLNFIRLFSRFDHLAYTVANGRDVFRNFTEYHLLILVAGFRQSYIF